MKGLKKAMVGFNANQSELVLDKDSHQSQHHGTDLQIDVLLLMTGNTTNPTTLLRSPPFVPAHHPR